MLGRRHEYFVLLLLCYCLTGLVVLLFTNNYEILDDCFYYMKTEDAIKGDGTGRPPPRRGGRRQQRNNAPGGESDTTGTNILKAAAPTTASMAVPSTS
jgi:hypothetical protein